MLKERNRLKKRVEANLSMGRGTFRNHSLLVMLAVGEEDSLVLSKHGQDFNQVRHIHSLRIDGSLSIWAGKRHFTIFSIVQVFEQFNQAIAAAILCSKGDAGCSSRLH